MNKYISKMLFCLVIIVSILGICSITVKAETYEYNVSFENSEKSETMSLVSIKSKYNYKPSINVYIHLETGGSLYVKSEGWSSGILDGIPKGKILYNNELVADLKGYEKDLHTDYLRTNCYLEAGDYTLVLDGGTTYSYAENELNMYFTPISELDTSGLTKQIDVRTPIKINHYSDDYDGTDWFRFSTKKGHIYELNISGFTSDKGSQEYTQAAYELNSALLQGDTSGSFDFKSGRIKLQTSDNCDDVYFLVKYSQEGNISYNLTLIDKEGIKQGPDGKLYYFKNNKEIDTKKTGVFVSGKYLYFVKKGVVDTTFNGLSKYKNSQYYFQNGVCKKNYTGVIVNKGSKFYVKKNKLDLKFTGVAAYNKTVYYFSKGAIDKGKTGIFKFGNKRVYIKNGKMGKVTQIVNYKDEKWYIENGVWQSDYFGKKKIANRTYEIVGGKVR